MALTTFVFVVLSLILFGQSLFSIYLMVYSWEQPERLAASSGPQSFLPPRLSFSVLLPARHEEKVIFETIRSVVESDYPKSLLEVVVICHEDDAATIYEARRAMRDLGATNVHLETFACGPISKPHGLNVGFQRTSGDVITIFDAEDDIDSSIFNVVNTVMQEEEVGIVQAGVQLMNFRDHWFGIHNVLEYYFWFKSRLHYYAGVGVVPLAGNTVFVRADLLNRVGGWDDYCLTEDADIGIRLSALGEPIRVVYDSQHVTREETPESVGALIRQRTRWHQGFLQVLRKKTWRELPTVGQRLLAFFTLSQPLFQALLTLLWPLSIAAGLWLKLPMSLTMASFLPLYALAFQFLITMVGAFSFTGEYRERVPLLLPITMLVTFLPYQWILGLSSVRAVYRELRRETDWEKTTHVGAHRRVGEMVTPAGTLSPVSQSVDRSR